VSWIAIDDLLGVIQFALDKARIDGPVNAVAPNPATNAELTKTLGRVLRRPTSMKIPALAARVRYGEAADELLLASARVLPTRLLESKFKFDYPTLEETLRHVLGTKKQQ
jgi:NAD dependent epimerase/dehydratase family enzyme